MKSLTEHLWFEVPSRRGFVNITDTVEGLVRKSGVQEGLCLVNAMHITHLIAVISIKLSPGGAVLHKPRVYAPPARLELNQWGPWGNWTIGKQATVLNQANGPILYQFHSRDLHLVMGPPSRGGAVRFRLLIDGLAGGRARH